MRDILTLSNDKWDQRFLDLAREVSTWSKDPSRQIGCIAVRDRKILATGYNGFPKGIDDRRTRYIDREQKYHYVVHAEMNAIYNAAENGVSLKGSTMYIYGLPVCSECAKGIIQVGVKRVVWKSMTKEIPAKWWDSSMITEEMFLEAGVEYERA